VNTRCYVPEDVLLQWDYYLFKDVLWLSIYSDALLAIWPGFDSEQWPEIFFYTTASKLALGPKQPPV
jgi:hypothetical protein